MNPLTRLSEKIIHGLENNTIPFINYLLTFLSVITLRHFAEMFSQPYNQLNQYTVSLRLGLLHETLSYVCVAFVLALLVYYATKTPIKKIIKVLFPCFILLLMTPSIDLITSQGTGYSSTYLFPGEVDLIYSYLTYFGGAKGISIGIKCEIFVVLLSLFAYMQCKGRGLLSSLFYTWLGYSCIFLCGASPFILKALFSVAGFQYQYSSTVMLNYFGVTIVPLGIWLAYLANPSVFLVLVKDLRPLRIMHYLFMLLLGITLGLSTSTLSIDLQLYADPAILVNTALITISIVFSCLFVIIFNNVADVEIDAISNPERPLIQQTIELSQYKMIGYALLVVALFYASCVGTKAFFLISFTIANYYLYSMPPLRLKRITVLSKLTISCNSLALVMLGYVVVHDSMTFFPTVLYPIFLIGYTLAANFIDIKDVAGDAAMKIKTLPVVIGVKQTKIVVGLAFFMTYLSFYYLFHNNSILLLLVILGATQFYLINKKNYREWPIIFLYLVSILLLIVYCAAVTLTPWIPYTT